MLRFFWLIHHESPRYNHAFSEKAQHLQRWISLQTFTRGRLVPRQPRAIKRTTRTELHHEDIYIVKYIRWNIGINPTALRCCNIRKGGFIHGNADIKPMALHGENIRCDRCVHKNISATPTALYDCYIHHSGYIHWNIGITATALHRYNIRHGWCIHWNISIFCYLFIRM